MAALVPIVLALVASPRGLGGIALLANAMDVSTAAPTIGAMIGLGIGIDYALFIVARYRENRAAGQEGSRGAGGRDGFVGCGRPLRRGTVVVAMGALALTGLGFLTSIGLGTALIVLVAVAAALTLLPALLTLLGDRVRPPVDRTFRGRRLRRPVAGLVRKAAGTAWSRIPSGGGGGAPGADPATPDGTPEVAPAGGAGGAQGEAPAREGPRARRASGARRRRTARCGRVSPAACPVGRCAICSPRPPCCSPWPRRALDMETGFPDAGNDSAHTTHRRAYDLVAEGFGPGANAPLLLVADLTRPGVGAEGITALAERVAADPGIASVGEPQTSPSGDTVVLAHPAHHRARRRGDGVADPRARPRARAGNVSVSGLTAMTDDLTTQLVSTLPVFVAATLGASFLLLLVVFRSVALPLKAVAVNLFSIAGAYGVVVAVFQWGWFGGLFGLEETLPIASPLPTVFFAVLFGLSMDYEVFLLSRVREEYDATGDYHRGRGAGDGGHGPCDHLCRADHDGGVPRLRGQPFAAGEDDGPGAGDRHCARRDDRAPGACARVDGAAGTRGLVAAALPRPPAAPMGAGARHRRGADGRPGPP